MSVRKIIQGAAISGPTNATTYVDDVFNTYLFTGTGATQSINTGIDLTVSGGMVWSATRSGTTDTNGPEIIDTVRGGSKRLITANNSAQFTLNDPITFTSSGITMSPTTNSYINSNNFSKILWSFKKAAKFFDIVTYTGDGTSNRNITHNLGVIPGLVIIKRTDSLTWGSWNVAARCADLNYALGPQGTFGLDLTGAAMGTTYNPTFTSSYINTDNVSNTNGVCNASGATYVAYLFAHDTAADSKIQCGSYTGGGTTSVSVNLGWEPQFLLLKNVSAATNWEVYDCMRGVTVSGNNSVLTINTANTEYVNEPRIHFNATGFYTDTTATAYENTSGNTFIYMAIRRSNKPPTNGTQVFAPVLYTGNSGTQSITTGFPVDLEIVNPRSAQGWNCGFIDRVRGPGRYLSSDSIGAEVDTTSVANQFQSNTGTNRNSVYFNASPTTFVDYAFKRAAGFFDIATWVGNGTLKTISHNLGVTPELIIVKHREVWPGQTWTYDWSVYYGVATSYLVLNTSAAAAADVGGNNRFGALATSTVFTVGNVSETNSAGGMHYVGYLFATLAGISKVGSYTGNGSSQTINCGFSAGARFILIKCTSATGDWFVWDTARGIITANDPHSSLNTNTAEVTTDDSIDPDNTGFIINQLAATNINVTSATYIFLAIA